METTVSQMSVVDLRKLISDVVSDVVEEKLAHFTDPDAGLEYRDDFIEMMKRQDERLAKGEKTVPMDQVMADLGI